ncbi:hypothetical protein Tco_1543126 [Tanacetum coccineum]
MFDEYLNPQNNIVSPVHVAATSIHADLTGTPLSTLIDQDAPFASTSPTQEQLQSPVISEGVEEQLQLAQTEEPNSQESSSNVQSTNPPFELLDKWTKNHPLEYVQTQELQRSVVRIFMDQCDARKNLRVRTTACLGARTSSRFRDNN